MNTGEKIKQLRIKNGITQKELANKSGLATGTIQQYELQKRKPKLETVEKIADALNVKIDELLDIDVVNNSLTEEFYGIYVSETELRKKLLKILIALLEQFNVDGMLDLYEYTKTIENEPLYKSMFYNNKVLLDKLKKYTEPDQED